MIDSVIYMANTNNQLVQNGEAVNFGTAIQRVGRGVSFGLGNAILEGMGSFVIHINITFKACDTGTIAFKIYRNNMVVFGATTSISTQEGNTYSVSIPAIIVQDVDTAGIVKVLAIGGTAEISNAVIMAVKNKSN